MKDAPLKLKKEVEPPQRSSNGLGVLIVASAAMFFAVASSAFILRVRMAAECRARAMQLAPPVIAPAAPSATPCGEAQITDNGDGTLTVTFDTCPPTVTIDGVPAVGPIATPLPADPKLAIPDVAPQ